MEVSEIIYKNPNIKFSDEFGLNILFFSNPTLNLTSFVIITNDMEHIICIDGFDKVYNFFDGVDGLLKLNSKDKILDNEVIVLPTLKITKSVYNEQNYFYLQPQRILFLFDLNVNPNIILIKKLKPKLICVNKGKIFTQIEGFLECLV